MQPNGQVYVVVLMQHTPCYTLARITGLNLKTILKNIIELQKKENVSINFLLNSIVMDFFKNNKEGNLSVSH